jgi:MFS transporter, CP family, cyanate transporter
MRRRLFFILLMVWLAGVAIRIPILAIPPVIPFIRADLNMSGTEVGALSGIPMILLAVAALPGSALVGWLGALHALLIGLLITAIGGLLRGFASTTAILFAATAVMGMGIAVTQPALPAIVRQWLPSRVGFGTAIYSNGLIAGCIIPVTMTLTLIMPALNNSWRLDLIIWSLPVFTTFAFLAVAAPRSRDLSHSTETHAKFLSGLNFSLIWRIGLIFGANNCVYFGTNAFLPPYLIEIGQPNLVTEALTAYNIAQLPGSIVVLALASRMERRHWPYVCAGLCLVLNLAWLATSTGTWTIVAATTLGAFSGITLAIGLMLPPLLSKSSEVARVAAAMFTVSYALAMIGSVAGGAVWDLLGHPRFAFLVLGVCALPLIVITPTLNFAQNLDPLDNLSLPDMESI